MWFAVTSVFIMICLKLSRLLLTLSCTNYLGDCSKILGIFPLPSRSHHVLGEALLKGLAQYGHQVTMISAYNTDAPMKNYKEIAITALEELKDKSAQVLMRPNATFIEKSRFIYEIYPRISHIFHNSSEVKDLLTSGKKYDACIISIVLAESMLGICNEVQAIPIAFSVVGLSSLITYYTRNPVPYSYVQSIFANVGGDMTFLERVGNILTWWAFDGIYGLIAMPFQERLVKKYYPNAPSLKELMDRMDITLINSHISTDTPKPLLPNIIPIGGFHLQIVDSLPKDLQNFMDNSKNGVLYFSLGSNARSSNLDKKVIDILLKTFEKLPYDVLWKFESDLPYKPKNVRIQKWLPQRTILMHSKVKAFLTHGGLGGMVESIYGGVPMVCMPLFNDQNRNCKDSANKGYAVVVDILTIAVESLTSDINEVITNPAYKHKIMLKSDLYRNQEMNPMKKAIFWVEHVIRHGGAKHMKSKATLLPFYQYYLLDVISFIGAVTVVLILLILLMIKRIVKAICCMIILTGRSQSKNGGKTKEKNKIKKS